MKKIFALYALFAVCVSASADGFSYKGLRVGDAANDVLTKLPDFRPGALPSNFRYRDFDGCLKLASSGQGAMKECTERVSIGGADIKEGTIYTNEGFVKTIDLSIYGGSGSALESSLVEAFGPPVKLDRPVFKNRMGAEFHGYLGRWENASDVMTYFRDGDGQNTLRITSKEEDAKRQERERERAKAGAKDF